MAINSSREDEELKESIKLDVLKRLFATLITYKKSIIVVIMLILLTVAAGVIYPLIIQRVIDVEVYNKDIEGLLRWMGVAFAIAIINLIATRIWRIMMAKIGNKVISDIRIRLYEHLQLLGLDFYDSRPVGKVLARVTGDVNSLKDVLSSTITQLVPEFITVFAVVIVMIITSPLLTLSALASIPIIIIGVYFCEIVAHKRWQIMRKKESNMTAFIHENIAGIGIIQSFNAEEETQEEFERIVDEHKKSFRDAVLVNDIFSPTIEISYSVGTFLLYYMAVCILKIDAAGIGTLTAFLMYMGMFWGPIRNLANYYNKLITNMSAAERVFEILDTKPLVTDDEKAGEIPPIKGAVSFRNVYFGYPDEPEKMILNNVSFEVTPGQTIALVGPTGAGKTTIISLISRFYNCSSGSIEIDGHDLKAVKIQSLRKQMGIMTQDNYLFSGTIKDNIRYGRLDATDEEIIKAAKAVHAHEFITKLEKGYDTEITERGGGLSIGQRQLIAFARTLVSEPAILILDEATSSIDTGTEILVQQGIETLLKGRTSFVVAHRLSTIKNADRIMVIDHGGIVEQGSHKELMGLEGQYYRLYTSQFI